VFVLIEALAQGDALTVVNTCEGLRLSGLSPSALLEDMCAVLQRMAVCQTAPSASEIDADPDPDASRVAELASLMPTDETQLLYSLCLHGRGELGLSTDAFAALTMVMLRLLAFKPGVSSTPTVTAEKKSLKTEAAPPPAPAPAPSPVSALRPPPATASVPAPPPSLDGAQVWFDCVQSLSQSQQIQAMVRELAMQSQLTHCDANLWQLQVASQSLMTASNIERLQAALQQAGHKVQLKVALGPVTDTPAMRLARMQEAQLAEIEQEILRDPMVQELVTQFDAKIIPGSLKPLHH
jgi:DNA polymerase-3 subunit gamma/tau